jgi:hypothetical protein
MNPLKLQFRRTFDGMAPSFSIGQIAFWSIEQSLFCDFATRTLPRTPSRHSMIAFFATFAGTPVCARQRSGRHITVANRDPEVRRLKRLRLAGQASPPYLMISRQAHIFSHPNLRNFQQRPT